VFGLLGGKIWIIWVIWIICIGRKRLALLAGRITVWAVALIVRPRRHLELRNFAIWMPINPDQKPSPKGKEFRGGVRHTRSTGH